MRITHHILASLCALLVAGCPRRARTHPEDVVQPTDATAPSASFDRLGERLAYVKAVRGKKRLAAIRDLGSGVEQLVDPGPGVLRAVRLDPDGEMLNLFLDIPAIEPPRASPARRGAKAP